MSARRPLIEILHVDPCANYEAARALIERVSRQLSIDPELRLVEVVDEEAALRLRFLGRPRFASRVLTATTAKRAVDRFGRKCHALLAELREQRLGADALPIRSHLPKLRDRTSTSYRARS
jgi:hypothetical protein